MVLQNEKKHVFNDGSSKHLYSVTIQGGYSNNQFEEIKAEPDKWRGVWFHDFYEVYVCLSDSITLLVNDKTYRAKYGDLLIYSNMDFHRVVFHSGMTYKRINVIFSPESIIDMNTPYTDLTAPFTKRPPDFNYIRHQTEEQMEWLCGKMQQIIDFGLSEAFGVDVQKKILLAEILLYVHDRYHSEKGEAESIGSNGYEKIKAILDYINDHLSEDLSLDHLAKQFFMSKYYLCHIFKESIGHTVNEYITFRRIMYAASLLKKGYSRVRVCEMIGVKNEDYFITLFKKITGMPPRKYLSQFQNI